MHVRNRENHKEVYRGSSFIMKKGDDSRKDAGILYMFRFFNELWKTNDSNLRYNGNIVSALVYKCIAMGFGANNLINFKDLGNISDNIYLSGDFSYTDTIIDDDELNFGCIEEIPNCKNLKDIRGIIKGEFVEVCNVPAAGVTTTIFNELCDSDGDATTITMVGRFIHAFHGIILALMVC